MTELFRKPRCRVGFTARLIAVTDLHIRLGKRTDRYECAVHLAIREQVIDEDFRVDGEAVMWEQHPACKRSSLPRPAQLLICHIDCRTFDSDTDPREFWLQIPTDLVRPEPAAQPGGPPA